MSKNKLFFFVVLGLVFVLGLSLFSSEVAAANCWQYTSVANGCTSGNGCVWKNDSWSSSGWCQELSCWSFSTQSECASTPVPGKNCTWQGGGTTYNCEKVSCWSFAGTDSNSCGNNSLGLSCDWSNYCYMTGYNPNANCGSLSSQSACLNTSGCAWGQCMDKGCWGYTTQNSCVVGKDWNSKNCTWNSANNYCEQNGCWKYYQNATACGNATGGGVNCEWKWNSCQEKDCYSYDFTNSSACVNNTINASCSWSNSYCMKKDCWSYNSNASCSQTAACVWKGYTSSGWCNEINCWNWDSYNGGNQTNCVNNAYGMSCGWSGNPAGNNTNGWCYKDWTTTSCANKTTEKDCIDTNYCWWQYTNWNNVSAGGNCSEPGTFAGVTVGLALTSDWNPGCYIFDLNSTDCNRTLGCNHNGTNCVVQNNAYGGNITLTGINCTYINDSSLCNNLPALSSCCSWNGSSCAANKLSTSCRDQMDTPPEGAAFCEDYNAYTSSSLCQQIAGSPWYMPCTWENSTGKCKFKASDVFGNGSQSLVKIENKLNCESAGGKWVTENYCEGNVSVPAGRCEYKFSDETNCDKACYGCESKNSDGTAVNASNAASACKESKLGSCYFEADTNAPNGIGYCKAKAQFKKGTASDCDSSCGDCTFKGDYSSNDTLRRPSYYCTTSKANSAGGGCKWMVDNSTENGGYCI